MNFKLDPGAFIIPNTEIMSKQSCLDFNADLISQLFIYKITVIILIAMFLMILGISMYKKYKKV